MKLDLKFSESGEQFSTNFGETSVIHEGQNGATFYPDVSDDGIISWTNDRGLQNPEPVNIKGEKGDPFTYADFTDEQLANLKGKDGADGKDGTNGKDGYTPQKGVDYFTPEDIAELNIPTVDQSYIHDSSNAQSGKAVAEAVAPKADKTYVNDIVNELNNRFPSIKTVMDEVAVASTQYYLGEVTELNITLPEDAEIGQEIIVSWYNGETASTLAIDGTMLEFDYIPSANSRSEISCLWDGRYWAVIGNEMAVPIDEVTNDA